MHIKFKFQFLFKETELFVHHFNKYGKLIYEEVKVSFSLCIKYIFFFYKVYWHEYTTFFKEDTFLFFLYFLNLIYGNAIKWLKIFFRVKKKPHKFTNIICLTFCFFLQFFISSAWLWQLVQYNCKRVMLIFIFFCINMSKILS